MHPYCDRDEHAISAGLDQLFRTQVMAAPDALAVVCPLQRLSYAELDAQAQAWYAFLHALQLPPETPVALLVEPGATQISLQIAIIRAGLTCVPLDSALPDQRLANMLSVLQCEHLVAGPAWRNRLPVTHQHSTEQPPPRAAIPHGYPALDGEQRTHILHTSGSSGTPKAVEVVARGITRLAFNLQLAPLQRSDRIAHISNPSFDASLFEIWGALLNGATVVVLPKQTILDPYALRESLRHNRITAMCITTALFNLTAQNCPDAFAGLHHVLVGGEAANVHALRQVLQHSAPINLRNAYGPTECTTYATSLHITAAVVQQNGAVSIGQPIDHTVVHLLDAQQQPCKPGQTGEIHLGGAGLARGYYGQRELTERSFVTLALQPGQPPIRLYRTGDMGRWRSDGNLDYLGRQDRQIKLSGFRIELEEIESALLATGMVSGAVVELATPASASAQPYLLAYVAPQPGASLSLEVLGQHIAGVLPAYMLPRLQAVPCIPLNANGKADRAALRQMQAAAIPASPLAEPASATQRTLAGIWESLLDLRGVGSDSDFFALGGSSLQAASLVVAVERAFARPLSIQALYENPTLSALANLLDHPAHSSAGLRVVDTLEPLRRDARLAEDLHAAPGDTVDWCAPTEGRVCLTGVTGFLGAYFLHDLLLHPSVQQVVCLVRARTADQAVARVQSNLQDYGLWQPHFKQRLQALPADLGQQWLGLGQTGFAHLSRWASVIFHLGAHVNYTQPYAAHRPANVEGTLNVLRLATAARAIALHYVSSIAAYGPTGLITGAWQLHEDEPLLPHLAALKYDTGYSQSQWVAEQLVRSAMDKGIAAAIYRPGFIMGDSARGLGNARDFVARLIAGCQRIGAFPQLPRQRKEFVCVDYVSRSLLQISSCRANLGRAYNLVPVGQTPSPDLEELVVMLNQCGVELEQLPYQQWLGRLRADPALEANPLMPLLPMLSEPVYGSLTRWEVYQDMPAYSTDNLRHALGDGLDCPVLDTALLSRYLHSWGLIKSPVAGHGKDTFALRV